jgi:hypothetical protein
MSWTLESSSGSTLGRSAKRHRLEVMDERMLMLGDDSEINADAASSTVW